MNTKQTKKTDWVYNWLQCSKLRAKPEGLTPGIKWCQKLSEKNWLSLWLTAVFKNWEGKLKESRGSSDILNWVKKLTEWKIRVIQPSVKTDTEWKKKTNWVTVTVKKSKWVQDSLNEQEDQSQSLNWLTFIVHLNWKQPILNNDRWNRKNIDGYQPCNCIKIEKKKRKNWLKPSSSNCHWSNEQWKIEWKNWVNQISVRSDAEWKKIKMSSLWLKMQYGVMYIQIALLRKVEVWEGGR